MAFLGCALELSWRPPGPFWDPLGRLLGRLGAILVASCALHIPCVFRGRQPPPRFPMHSGHLGGLLGLLRGPLELSWRPPGPFRDPLGRLLGRLVAIIVTSCALHIPCVFRSASLSAIWRWGAMGRRRSPTGQSQENKLGVGLEPEPFMLRPRMPAFAKVPVWRRCPGQGI